MRGFTLIELLVVAAIIGVLSVIVIVGQGSFSKTLLLSNTASDIALSLRSAQVYGVGSRTVGTGAQAVNNAPYGLDFSSSATSYTFFADTDPAVNLSICSTPDCKPGNGWYTSADTSIQTYTVNNGIQISNFCALLPPAAWYCKTGGSYTITHLSISFTRPNTTAIFGVGSSGSNFTSVSGTSFTQACIKVESPVGGATPRYLSVNQAGQVASASSCP